MNNKFQLTIFMLILLMQSQARGNVSRLLDGNFEYFINDLVSAHDQHDFRVFYNNMLHDQQMKKLNGKQKDCEKLRKKITSLQEQGKMSLEVRNPTLAQELEKYTVSKRKQIHTLFFRYGVYEEYLKSKANKQKSILTKTKSYLRDAGNKVTSWFGSLRKPKTVTT